MYHSVEWYWPLERLLWVGTGGIWEISTMENSSGIPLKIKNISTMWSSNPTSGYITKLKSRSLKRDLHAHMWVHTCVLLLQSCLTICGPRDCSPPGNSVQEHWSGFPCPPPGYLPDPGIELTAPALQANSLLLSHHPHIYCGIIHNSQDKETSQRSMNSEWMKTMRYTHTVESHSALKVRKFCYLQHGWT